VRELFEPADFLPGSRLDTGQDLYEAGKQLHDLSHRTLTNRRAKSTGTRGRFAGFHRASDGPADLSGNFNRSAVILVLSAFTDLLLISGMAFADFKVQSGGDDAWMLGVH